MLIHIGFALGVLTQSPSSPPGERRGGDPGVRVWVSDSLYQVGAGARVYVKLREPGYLVVLHIDAMGRIRVLYPAAPDDQAVVPADAPFEVAGTSDNTTFRVETRGRGTLLAARTLYPFAFEPLRRGARWDYAESLLLQPSAGNPFAALLDIADRVADGQPYDYDVTAYGTPGAVASRAASDTVCFSCLTQRHSHSPASGGTGYGNGALAIDHSYAAANNSSVVDCSAANLIDSFCGVQDNSVTNTYNDYSTYESNTVVYPAYEPFFFPFRRVVRPPPPEPTPPRPAITLPKPLRPVSRRLVPPPVRERPRFVVIQPTAPSRPERAVAPVPTDPPTAPAVQPARMVRAASGLSVPQGTAQRQQPRAARTGTMANIASFGVQAPVTRVAPAPAVRPAGAATRTLVPSRAQLRSINSARH